MKAIRVHQAGGPEVLKLEDVADSKPDAGQVLIEVKAVGVNPVETYVRSGKYPLRTGYPYTPGADAAGIVKAVGADVNQFKPGDRVYTGGTKTGAYAQLTLCDAAQVHPLPENVTFAQGAAVGVPYATAWRALLIKASGKAGEMVLVHGASGGVGIAAVQIARAAGMVVIGTAGSERGIELVKKEGADHVFNHKTPDYMNQIMTATGGRGVDVILEMAAHVNLGNDLGVLAKGGRLAVIGSRGPVTIDARETMGKESSIIGTTLFLATPEELHRVHAAIFAGLSNGSLRPVINRELPLGEAGKAHELVMEAGAYGKIVLVP
jgi:NADPH2:quinone reductase